MIFAPIATVTLHRLHPRDADRKWKLAGISRNSLTLGAFAMLNFVFTIRSALPRVVTDH